MKENLETAKKLLVIKECLIDYVGPLFIIGNINDLLEGENIISISATMPKENFAIINNKIPKWVRKVNLKSNYSTNILVIKDMDKINVDRQEILLEILEDNQISTEKLPENLKIILNSEIDCDINYKIRDIVELYKI